MTSKDWTGLTPKIQMKDESGNIITLKQFERIEGFEENAKIAYCNRLLQDKGLPELTEDEIKFMLDPTRHNNIELTPENLQKLAGVN